MSDPHARPHGGESLSTFASRVAGWLDAQSELHAHEGRWMVAGVNRPASPEGSAT